MVMVFRCIPLFYGRPKPYSSHSTPGLRPKIEKPKPTQKPGIFYTFFPETNQPLAPERLPARHLRPMAHGAGDRRGMQGRIFQESPTIR